MRSAYATPESMKAAGSPDRERTPLRPGPTGRLISDDGVQPRLSLQRTVGNRAALRSLNDLTPPPAIDNAATAQPSSPFGSQQAAAVRRPGVPLDPPLRRAFEQQFGRDLGHVRLHLDPVASRAAGALGARAFSLGRHVAIKQGLYDPSSTEGRRLLAHEMTHVVQQAGFHDHQLEGAPVLGADHPSERQASTGSTAITPLAAPAVQLDREGSPDRPDPHAESEAIIDAQDALLDQIEQEFTRRSTRRTPGTREGRLASAFSSLEPSYAAIVERAVANRTLNGFERLPKAVRQRLTGILAQRKASVPLLTPGIYGRRRAGSNEDYFVVRLGVTVDEVAHFLSDDPTLAATLARENKIPQGQLLEAGTPVNFPKGLAVRPDASQRMAADVYSGTWIPPWSDRKVKHSGERDLRINDIPLTKSEYQAVTENQRAYAPQKPPTEAEQAAALAEDRRRSQLLPNPFLSFLFPTSRLYVKDQSLLIHNQRYKEAYRTNMRGFDAGTNLNRASAAGATAAALVPLAVLEAPAAGAIIAESGAGEALAFGARHVYLNAPALYADALLYSGAVATGVKLGQHVVKIRSSGFDLSDIPQFAEDLAPAAGAFVESNNIRTSIGSTPAGPPTTSTSPPVPARPSWFARQLRSVSLAAKVTAQDVIPETSNIGGTGVGRQGSAQIQSSSRAGTPSAVSRPVAVDPANAPDTPAPARAQAPSAATVAPAAQAPAAAPATASAQAATASDVDLALSEGAQFVTGALREVNRVRTTGSGRQLSSLDTISRTAAQAGPIRELHGQRMSGPQRAAWQAATNQRERNDLTEVRRLWNLGDQQSRDEARTLARAMFDRHRGRYWRTVRKSPALRATFERAGMRFTGSNSSAPVYDLPDGTVARMTIEHSQRLTDDPTRGVAGSNLQFVLDDENSVFLEFIRRFDPFQ